jgi:hypothetical protein
MATFPSKPNSLGLQYFAVHLVYTPHWRPMFDRWSQFLAELPQRTEEQSWAEISSMLAQWKWYRCAAELMKKDLADVWLALIAREREFQTPGKWRDDWTPDMIQNNEGWTLELWLFVNRRWTKYHLTIDKLIIG